MHGRPERLVWIFGSPRSGSTWLAQLLTQLTGGAQINEPLIGAHLGLSVGNMLGLPVDGDPLLTGQMSGRPSYFFAEQSRDVWGPPLRNLIIDQLDSMADPAARFVFVKEPWGSGGAPMLMRLLPESRMIFLARDGRDVVDSLLAGADEGWITDALGAHVSDREHAIREISRMWVRGMKGAQDAYDLHAPGLRHLVRYEDLVADTPNELDLMANWLHVTSDSQRVADRKRFSTQGRKGFFRAATPGLWQENLTVEEQAIAESVMGPTLANLGYT